MPLIGTDELGHRYSGQMDSTTGVWTWTRVSDSLAVSAIDNSVSIKAINLISSALRLIGVLASGEQPSIDEANDALMVLNQMVDGWNAEGRLIFATTADDYALVPGKQAYTLGPSGDWNTNRPARINSASVILLNNPANPIEISIPMYTEDEWQTELPVKATNGTFPTLCYDDGGFPLRTLSMWPIPQQVNNLRIYAWQPLGAQSTLQSVLNYPPGYAEALRYNLAVRLAPEFAQPVSAVVAQIANQALARIKSMNAPDLKLRSDLAGGDGGRNYRAEMFGIPY